MPGAGPVHHMRRMSLKLSRSGVFLAGLVVATFAFVAAGCGGGGGGGAPEALPSSSCTAIEYKGDGDPDYIIASDLPLQGSSRTQTLQMVDAIRYQLEQQDWKAALAAYESVVSRSPDATLRDWARERATAMKTRMAQPSAPSAPPQKPAPKKEGKS